MTNVVDYIQLHLDDKPCIVKYLEECDNFLIGTYEQLQTIDDIKRKFSTKSERELIALKTNLNDRYGSLLVISNSIDSSKYKRFEIITNLPCMLGGGVFDFTAIYRDSGEYEIYVAHSNGKVGFYIYKVKDESIILKNIIQVLDSTMLTCIDYFDMKSKNLQHSNNLERIVIGNSDGRIAIIDLNTWSVMAMTEIVKDLSIWQVKLIPISWSDESFILVTVDESCWYIYQLDESLHQVYKSSRNDFDYGITSVSFISHSKNVYMDSSIVLIGSYEGQIRAYSISLIVDSCKPLLVQSIASYIIDGGVWRMKPIEYEINATRFGYDLFVSAMHGHSLIIDVNFPQPDTEEQSDVAKIEFGSKPIDLTYSHLNKQDCVQMNEQSLHYGIDVSNLDKEFHRTCCTTDFNNNLVHFFILNK